MIIAEVEDDNDNDGKGDDQDDQGGDDDEDGGRALRTVTPGSRWREN